MTPDAAGVPQCAWRRCLYLAVAVVPGPATPTRIVASLVAVETARYQCQTWS